MIIKPKMLLFISAGLMTREIGFVNVKTISGYRKSNELFNWAKGASVDIFFGGAFLAISQALFTKRIVIIQFRSNHNWPSKITICFLTGKTK